MPSTGPLDSARGDAGGFFRDPDAYHALATSAVAEIVSRAGPNQVIRAWIAGCATGEDAYSVVMLLLEAIADQGKSLGVQVFATDTDRTALDVARAGVYAPAIVGELPAARLQRFFIARNSGAFLVRPRLRDVISFAVHDLFGDPPLSRMDLIACPGRLAHTDPDTREHTLSVLHFALNPRGYMFLGSSEPMAMPPELFHPVDERWGIYQRVGTGRSMARSTAALAHRMLRRSDPAPARPRERPGPGAVQPELEALLNSRLPPSVVLASDNRILYAHGDLHPYLRYPKGPPRFEIVSALRDDLGARVRSALYRCRRDDRTVVVLSSAMAGDGVQVEITVSPAHEVGAGAVVLSFAPVNELPTRAPSAHDRDQDDRDRIDLESELIAHRDDLHTALAELDTAREELKASNEESMSMNEELRAANEELEATSEELRSLNDELFTVNAQLRDKIEQLEQAHDDLSNFFASTQLATLFLGESLCIKRFTPAAGELLGLRVHDLGRDIRDLPGELLQMDLAEDAGVVLTSQIPHSREVKTKSGRWYIRRLLPYRTEAHRVAGVVVTWIDVTELKQTTARVAVRERQQAVIARLGLRALEADDLDAFMDHLVAEVTRALDTDCCKVLELQHGGDELLLRAGVGWKPGLVGQATVGAGLSSQAGYTLSLGEPVVVADLASETRFSGPALLHDHRVVSGMSCVIRDGDDPYGVLGAHTRTPRAFTEDDSNFLQAVANVLGGAISRKKARRRLAVDRGVARALSEYRMLDDAMPSIFEVFVREFGACVGQLFTAVPDDRTLACTAFSIPDELDRHDELRRIIASSTCAPGQGLVGRVWQRARAEWLTDLAGDHELADPARNFGFVCGFAFPILIGHQASGVISLLSRQRITPDSVFVAGLDALGAAIGEFIRHAEADSVIRASEERFRLAVEAAGALVYEATYPENLIVSMLGAERLLGETPTMPAPVSWWLEHIHPDDLPRCIEHNKRVERGQQDLWTIEYRMRHRDGHYVNVEGHGSIVREGHGAPRRIGVVLDISDSKRSAAILADRERRLQRTFDTSHLGIAFAHGDGRVTRCNDAALAMLGYSRHDFDSGNIHLRALSPPEFRQRDRQAIAELLVTGRLDPAEKELVRKDGDRITVLLSATALGFAGEFVAFLVDLTRQKRTEAELSKLAAIVESSDDAILSKDMSGTILSWNHGAERLYGYAAEEMVGKPVEIIIPAERQDELDHIMRQIARGEHIDSHETVRQRKVGSQVHVSVTISPVTDKWGNIIGASAVARDITERKRAEEALREADRQKDQFLAMLGHELRNPLAAIRNASELLKLIDVQNRHLDRTRSVLDRQTAHMSKLIDGLLDVSRMVRGKIALDEEIVDVVEILDHVLQDHASQIASQGLVLHSQLPAAPLQLAGDRVRLAQIFDNLLSNAVKFTPPAGSITVTARRDDDTAVIVMRDSGVGIEPELLPHIFEPFRQAVQPLDRSAGGLGLGLALVKGVVTLHGGEVEARSEGENRGAEFIVRLPLLTSPVRAGDDHDEHHQRNERHDHDGALPAPSALRLLVVEGRNDTAELLRELLAASSHEVAVAYSAARALTIARAFKPDVILCDIRLQGELDGYDLARAVRADDTLRDAFLIALASDGRADERHEAADAGFDAHLARPISLDMLQAALARKR